MAKSYLIVTCPKCDTRYNPYWGTGRKRDRCPGFLATDVPCDEGVPDDALAASSSKQVSSAGEIPEAPKPKPKAKKAAKGK